MSHIVEEIDFDDLSDEELGPLLARFNTINREMHPRTADMTIEDFRIVTDSPGMVQRRWLARNQDHDVVGMCDTRYADDGTNPDIVRIRIHVWPEYRRRGAGTAMLGRVCRGADEVGRSRLLGMHLDTIPAGAGFARACGAKEGLQLHENVLKVDDLDVDLMRAWVEQGEKRAQGYSLVVVHGEPPVEALEDLAHLFRVLERDMPMTHGMEPRNWTADTVRDMREHFKQGVDTLSSLAIHEETGEIVGMSELVRRHSDPATWVVTVTMVDPAHRGKSIGKWLKGAVNLAALEHWPGGVYEETANHFTNEAMLAINRSMGFQHELTITNVEIDVEDARTYVESRRER